MGDIRDDIKTCVCPICHIAILYDHPQFSDQLKCSICGYAEYKARKANAYGYYPVEKKPKE